MCLPYALDQHSVFLLSHIFKDKITLEHTIITQNTERRALLEINRKDKSIFMFCIISVLLF